MIVARRHRWPRRIRLSLSNAGEHRAGTAHIINGDDVRVLQAGDDTGFGEVGFCLCGAGNTLSMRSFDGHRPVQLVVVGRIDPPEPTFAQDFVDPVATDLLRQILGDGM